MELGQELTAAQLCEAYRNGRRTFRNIEIVDSEKYPTISDLDLHDCELTECWFHSATFSNVSFNRTRFVACNLKCATFKNCDLRESYWRDCAVCSLAITNSSTGGLQIEGLHAYGATIDDAIAFLEYAAEVFERSDATKP